MTKKISYPALEKLGRVQLSPSFFMRDMLYSEISNYHRIPNIPDFPDIAIRTGRSLCLELLEPLQITFGRISIRSAYRSPAVNKYGNENKLNCSTNEKNYAAHIWDYPNAEGYGAMATIVVNRFIPYFERTGDWQSMAWYIHDNLPYSTLYFFPKLAAFNIGWHEKPIRQIGSYITPRTYFSKLNEDDLDGDHSEYYKDMLSEVCGNRGE